MQTSFSPSLGISQLEVVRVAFEVGERARVKFDSYHGHVPLSTCLLQKENHNTFCYRNG